MIYRDKDGQVCPTHFMKALQFLHPKCNCSLYFILFTQVNHPQVSKLDLLQINASSISDISVTLVFPKLLRSTISSELENYVSKEFSIVFWKLVLIFINIYFQVQLYSQSIIIMTSRECPLCKTESLRFENGVLFCPSVSCTFVDVHPINYENDVVQFEGETGQTNRYSTIFHKCYDNGGSSIGRQSYFDANFKRAKKIISNCCFVLKLSQSLSDLAESRAFSILKILFSMKQESQKEDKKERHKNYFSVKNVSCYSVFSACFEKENYFEEFNICKFAGISLAAWKDVVRELNNFLKDKIDFIPITHAKHVIMRVCRKRKIRSAQEKAMIEMSERIYASGQFDIRNNTIAAIAFWKVCQFSALYSDQINLTDVCKSHEKMIAEGVRQSQIWKCFDVTPENVRKVFKESINTRLDEFLPNWEGMIPLSKREF